jgi:large subunit ribosomal protein L17
MRHQIAGYRLGRSTGQRNALRRTLIKQLFEHERIQTTHAKARAIRSEAEKLITLARNSNKSEVAAIKVNARRLVAARLGGASADLVKKLFDDIGPRFATRPGGYTRILKLGPRLGDAAEMVLLELVEE